MKLSKKIKWGTGLTGVALSALMINEIQDATPIDATLSEREQEILQLDWTNFEVTIDDEKPAERQTRRT
ncbi:hypothetical protein GCM10007425_08700 [Lysinibacillus alkalisoli]|uniref:Uncharacterized protein n=1 Tax=Lysinibacillus alkalisoli TaxID=1911548 RepID=A0A917G0F2_9BACI|nr:hypothetical protein [Lysinibacillus alkalisoli]GGG16622.1 hypothetical protein GCM10007425_08700 [Lysinibacillus alkalisoli]